MAFARFYDSASPQDIPSGVRAAAYINGFVWPMSEQRRMSGIIRVSVLPEAHWASFARVIDVETGAASPGDVPGFVRERQRLGHDDAIAYVNQSNRQAVIDAVAAAGLPQTAVRYWVATLNGHPILSPSECWAEQYLDNANRYDVSVLYGDDVFHAP